METIQETKWRADELGPRQTKAFNEALSAFSWAARTYTEVTDHGEHSFTNMFGGGNWNPAATPAMEAIKLKYGCLVTPKNYQQIVADIEAVIPTLAATRVRIDKRSTPEERAERERIREENAAKQRERDAEALRRSKLIQHNYGLAETARAIKRVLNVLYPATQFSVTSKSYSGGCSIDVSWTDGPSTVKDILDLFNTHGFDGMTDMEYSHGSPEWRDRIFHFTGKYVHGQRSHSADFLRARCVRFAQETMLDSPEVKAWSDRSAYLDRDGATPCGWKYFPKGQAWGDGGLSKDGFGHDTAVDVVNQMAHDTEGEAPTIPFVTDWNANEPEPENSVRNVVFAILTGEPIPVPLGTPRGVFVCLYRNGADNEDDVFIAAYRVSDAGRVRTIDGQTFLTCGCGSYDVGECETCAKEAPAAAASIAIESTGGVTISENTEKDGIEIKFAARPDDGVLAALKANGWRWSRFSHCWYKRRSPEAARFASEIAGGAQ